MPKRTRPRARALGRASLTLLGAGLLLGLASGCKSFEKPWADQSPAADSRVRYEAMMKAQRLATADPDNAGPKPSFDTKLSSGDQLRDAGDSASAIWSYLEALRLDPESNEPTLRIGYLHLEKDPDRSAAIFTAIADEEPESHRPLLGLGIAHLARARTGDAIEALEAAQQLAPEAPAVLATLGVAYQHAGRNEESRELLGKANELEPGNARILNNLGVAQLLTGDPEAAEKTFEAALLVKPNDRITLNNLGLALGRTHQYGKAKRAFERANDKKSAANNLGWVYYLNGDYERALTWYEQALLQPGEGQITILENIATTVAAIEGVSPAAPAPQADEEAETRRPSHPRVE